MEENVSSPFRTVETAPVDHQDPERRHLPRNNFDTRPPPTTHHPPPVWMETKERSSVLCRLHRDPLVLVAVVL